jgi:glyoxylase-like metal-dependent hydrolase (beta-lactamase superfamily II)
MPVAREFEQIAPGIGLWQTYDPIVKADLFSTALATKKGVFLVDPIELDAVALNHLTETGSIAGIVLTNGNHLRSAEIYLHRFCVPLFAFRNSLTVESSPNFTEITDGARIGREIETISIEGAGPGEIALYHASDGGTLVIGDALINFDPYGFAFLPDKYCENARQMRKSLRKLLRYNAERILFAHGPPIMSGASARLQQLLDVNL